MMILGGGVLSGTHRMLSVFPPSLAVSLSLSLVLTVSCFLSVHDSVPPHRMNSFSFPVKKFQVSSLLEAK